MMSKKPLFITLLVFLYIPFISAQEVNEEKMGSWYMYFWNTEFKESQFGLQGDVQYRNWNIIGDLEQLLIRGGFTYSPKKADVKFTLGYANITSGAFGESNSTSSESRIYQEALLPQKVASCIYLVHRFRYEQRWVENQDFRSRFRYNIFLNIPLNKPDLKSNALYLAFYNEIFINGERDTGNGTVEIFDRNRLYTGLGYALTDKMRIQLGFMEQTSTSLSKGQLQMSLHHTF